MNDLFITIIVAFLPGVIATFIFNLLTVQKQKDRIFYFAEVFIFGFLAYLIYAVYVSIFISSPDPIFIFDIINRSSHEVNFNQLGIVTLISFFLGILFTYLFNYKVAFRIAHFLKMTKRFGDLDVWAYTMNSPDIDWVTVRDKSNDLTYTGWINAFSDTYDTAELLLKDVTVFNSSTGDEIYKVGAKYLSFEKDNIDLEFFNVKLSDIITETDSEDKNGKTTQENNN